MFSLLLAIIYIAFISLGLPDSLLGSAWPVMISQLNVPVSYLGIVTMIISGGTIVSSLLAAKLMDKLGAGLVTAFSVLLTAAALFCFSFCNSFALLCVCAIPYGLGAGAVDAVLNNYVALHYPARHMSWLHCFWGIGASVSPLIMGFCLTSGFGWNSGYRTVGIIQTVLTLILFLSLPLWKKSAKTLSDTAVKTKSVRLVDAVRIKGVVFVMLTFFGYCALESTAGSFATSYLTQYRGIEAETASYFGFLFYIGVTLGRFVCGFISEKVGDKRLIRFGIILLMCGVVLIALPVKTEITAFIGLAVTGLGCAPIYPSIIHATPFNFGKENSQTVIGIQMASAYVGSTFMPLLFGIVADNLNIGLYPLYLLVFAVLMIIMSELLNNVNRKKALSAN